MENFIWIVCAYLFGFAALIVAALAINWTAESIICEETLRSPNPKERKGKIFLISLAGIHIFGALLIIGLYQLILYFFS